MPRGSKDKYTDKQKDKAAAIEKQYEAKGVPAKTAEARAWATVNKQSGGGEKSGGGRTTSPQAKSRARHDSAERAAASRKGESRSSTHALASQTKASLLAEARAKGIAGRSTMDKQALINALHKAS
ncbi:termination factor Rho [Pseudomonas sp. RIT-PI-S]|uniref:termination factor Rho n=1 Tax=Pseudomonas sp. RIT-PI-S TaxID=3035295 RepID=UPI0021D9E3B7|nr:termination factor Rho [Pseudomonas sp. RIT-PI-S]